MKSLRNCRWYKNNDSWWKKEFEIVQKNRLERFKIS